VTLQSIRVTLAKGLQCGEAFGFDTQTSALKIYSDFSDNNAGFGLDDSE